MSRLLQVRCPLSYRPGELSLQAGGIVVIQANTPHRFVNSGDTTLRQSTSTNTEIYQTNLDESLPGAPSPSFLHTIV
jgi:hypothetical protein